MIEKRRTVLGESSFSMLTGTLPCLAFQFMETFRNPSSSSSDFPILPTWWLVLIISVIHHYGHLSTARGFALVRRISGANHYFFFNRALNCLPPHCRFLRGLHRSERFSDSTTRLSILLPSIGGVHPLVVRSKRVVKG